MAVITSAEQCVQISEFDIKTTKALLLPRIGLYQDPMDGIKQTTHLVHFSQQCAHSLQLGASLTWDIFR
jgi:hypothetical protein